MARLPRYGLPGQPQHVIQRGNNRAVLFATDADYRRSRRIKGSELLKSTPSRL